LEHLVNVKVKVKANACFAQKCFTISEVAADWHELMMPQHSIWPSIDHINEQLDTRFAASRHTTTPISHISTSPRSS